MAAAAPGFKVTVVVPTYRSSEHLDDLVASLDAQTLPQGEFEVLLVDDGSPDGTVARLEEFARSRPNHRVFALEHSGWPSRPRNHGIDEARGEYIVFADHDDRIFPDGLRAAWALASRNRADVLDGKESRSDTPGWAMRDITADVDNAIDWQDRHPLLPMNPHKMFRTAFLREQGVRFPEGGRQIWEDIHFDITAHARAEVVSLLVETPFYYWHRPPEKTTSATFYDDLDEYLDAIRRVFRWIDEELRQERFDRLRETFLAYQLHMRVLPLFFTVDRTDSERARIRDFATELLPGVPPAADAHLDPWRRIEVALLRAGRFELVERHERTRPRLVCIPTAHDVRWSAEGLSARVEITWELDSPSGPAVVRDGDRLTLALDPAVAVFAAEHGLSADVTSAVDTTTFAIDRRSRNEKIDWMLSVDSGARLLRGDGVAPVLEASVPLTWTPVDDGPGRLHDGPWDFSVRTVVLGTRVVRQVRTTGSRHLWTSIGGRLMAAYRTQNGSLAVDVGQTLLHVVDDGDLRVASAPSGALVRFVADLAHVEVHDDLVVAGEALDAAGRPIGAVRVVADARGARLEGEVPASVGAFAVAFGGRASRTRFAVRRGRVRIVRADRLSPRALARRAWGMVPDDIRRQVRIWRRRG